VLTARDAELTTALRGLEVDVRELRQRTRTSTPRPRRQPRSCRVAAKRSSPRASRAPGLQDASAGRSACSSSDGAAWRPRSTPRPTRTSSRPRGRRLQARERAPGRRAAPQGPRRRALRAARRRGRAHAAASRVRGDLGTVIRGRRGRVRSRGRPAGAARACDRARASTNARLVEQRDRTAQRLGELVRAAGDAAAALSEAESLRDRLDAEVRERTGVPSSAVRGACRGESWASARCRDAQPGEAEALDARSPTSPAPEVATRSATSTGPGRSRRTSSTSTRATSSPSRPRSAPRSPPSWSTTGRPRAARSTLATRGHGRARAPGPLRGDMRVVVARGAAPREVVRPATTSSTTSPSHSTDCSRRPSASRARPP